MNKRKRTAYPLKHWNLTAKVNRQAIQLYGFIVEYYARHGYMPAVSEMCVFMDGRSTSIVEYHMNVLIGWEWIERIAKTGRGLRLMRPTERGLSAEDLRKLLGMDVVPELLGRGEKRKVWKPSKDRAVIRRQVRPFQP